MKTIVALLMITVSGVAAAQINKCVDKSGKVVGYGAECPPGSRAEQMAIKGTGASAGCDWGNAGRDSRPSARAEIAR